MFKKKHLHMFDTVDTVFNYERDLIVSSFLQDFTKGKESSFPLFFNAHTAFLLCGQIFSPVVSFQNFRPSIFEKLMHFKLVGDFTSLREAYVFIGALIWLIIKALCRKYEVN